MINFTFPALLELGHTSDFRDRCPDFSDDFKFMDTIFKVEWAVSVNSAFLYFIVRPVHIK